MAEPYASVADYTKRHRATLDAAGTDQVAELLVDASAIIRSKLPRNYEPPTDIARVVCVAIVHRAIVNPGGRTYKQVGSTAESYGSQSGLYVTEDEEELLLADLEKDSGSSRAYTIGLRDQAYESRHYDPRYYQGSYW